MFGNQTLVFETVAEGAKDPWGVAAPVLTDVPVSGCRFRPLNATETVELTDRAVEMWQGTVPPHVAAMTAKPNGRVKYSGPETGGVVVVFEIDGRPMTFPDANGEPFKVTVMCKRQQIKIA